MNRARMTVACVACFLTMIWAFPAMADGKSVISVGRHHRSHIHVPDRGVHYKGRQHSQHSYRPRVIILQRQPRYDKHWNQRYRHDRRWKPDCRRGVRPMRPWGFSLGFSF